MPQDFWKKTVIVTGGGSGIGRAAAMAFGAQGANVVVVTGSNTTTGEDTAEAIRRDCGEALYIRCDIADEHQVERLMARTVECYGQIDYAFNNAGIGPDGVRIPFHDLTELPAEQWDRIMAVNAKGTFLCLKYELRQMMRQGGGAIVNTASVGGLRMATGFGAYGPSKAAVIALTRTAALEGAKFGIRVNAVCPGPTLGTDLMRNSMASGSSLAAGGDDAPPIPLGKFGRTEDVVQAVLWLCSEKAGHITGHALSVDGGMADIG